MANDERSRLNLHERLTAIDDRFTSVERRFDAIDDRFDLVDARFGVVTGQIESLRRCLEAQPDLISASLASQLQRQHLTLLGLFVTTWAAIAGLIALIVVQ